MHHHLRRTGLLVSINAINNVECGGEAVAEEETDVAVGHGMIAYTNLDKDTTKVQDAEDIKEGAGRINVVHTRRATTPKTQVCPILVDLGGLHPHKET